MTPEYSPIRPLSVNSDLDMATAFFLGSLRLPILTVCSCTHALLQSRGKEESHPIDPAKPPAIGTAAWSGKDRSINTASDSYDDFLDIRRDFL